MATYHQNNDQSKRTKCDPKNSQLCSTQIESLCLCPVCYMKFNENSKLARILHCGHTFCTECIVNVKEYGSSANVDCPTCRFETKAALHQIAPNYMLMELIRNCGLLGLSANTTSSPIEPRQSPPNLENQTIAELVDANYRQLITNIKTDLQEKFEQMKEDLTGCSLESAEEELAYLCDTVECAVRDAYSMESSESDNDNDDRETSFSSTTTVDGDDLENCHIIENPLNYISSSDISFETTEESDETDTNLSSFSSRTSFDSDDE